MKILRTILLALLFSFLLGITIGTVIRLRMESQPAYIGLSPPPSPSIGDSSPSVVS